MDTVGRFIDLLYHKEERYRMHITMKVVAKWIFSLFMLARAISENLLRTGSKMIFYILGEHIDISDSSVSKNATFTWVNNVFVIFQTFFPCLIGIIMLYVYFYLGYHSEAVIKAIDGHEEEDALTTHMREDGSVNGGGADSLRQTETYIRFSS